MNPVVSFAFSVVLIYIFPSLIFPCVFTHKPNKFNIVFAILVAARTQYTHISLRGLCSQGAYHHVNVYDSQSVHA